MYGNITPKTAFRKGKEARGGGFTLVEIMIVIVIIVLLTQLGNIGGLFRSRERNKVEEIAVKIVAALDEQKVDSLLGKTLNGNIVRKRLTTIELKNDEYKISMTTEANLANSEESIYDTNSKTTKSWSLNGMESFFYECPTNNTPLPLTDLEIYFREDALEFESKTSANVPNHIVLLLTHINTAHEIHVDKRTGLTYEIDNKGKGADGKWQITCN